MGFATKGFLLLQLSVLLLSCFSVFADEHKPLPPIPPPAEAPTHHHRYHNKHHHPTSQPPVHPPSHPYPPVHPPTHSPAYPPTHHHHHHHHHGQPPSQPPVHPPTHHAPGHPPMHPPIAPHPPMYPPVHPHPPMYPPVHPFPRSFIAVQGVVYCKSCKYAGVDTLMGASPISGATVKLQCNNSKYPLVETAKTDKNGYFFITAPKTVTSYAYHKCKVFIVSSPLASCNKPSNLHHGLEGSLLKPEKAYVTNKLPFVLYTVGPFAFEPKCPR